MKVGQLALGVSVGLLLTTVAGCSDTPDKPAVEKKVRDGLAAASPDWKDVKYDTRVNDTVSVVLASRVVNGKNYEYSFSGGHGSGGVAVRGAGGDWLCKYRYDGGKEVESTKMGGTDDDVNTFRPTANELATVAIKTCP